MYVLVPKPSQSKKIPSNSDFILGDSRKGIYYPSVHTKLHQTSPQLISVKNNKHLNLTLFL